LRFGPALELKLFLEHGMLEWLKKSSHTDTRTSVDAICPPKQAPRSELLMLMTNMMEANDYGVQPEN
jgi:hypothetical protein